MPAETRKQQKYIYFLRGKYKTKSDTPEKFKWIWDEGYSQVKERYVPFNFNEDEEELDEKSKTVDGYLSPEGGDISDHDLDILAKTYASCRKKDSDKTKCSKIAWSAVNKNK